MQRFEHSPLLYEEGFSVIINDVVNPPEESALYYFDYDSRSQDSHMKFPHSHRFYEIFILLSPRALHFVEGMRYDLVTNDIVLLAPHVLHRSEYLPGTRSHRIIISFMLPRHISPSAAGYGEILSIFHSGEPVFRFHQGEQERLFEKLNEIALLNRQNRDGPALHLMTHTKMTEFLYILYTLKEKNIYKPNTESGIREKIYSVANYIHMHYGEEISLSGLSRHFYISSYYLAHQFKKITGYTLIQYLQRTRINNAQSLLIMGEDPISLVAEKTGFSSFSQFNRVFKKYSGISPRAYRKKSRGRDVQIPPHRY